MVTLLEEMRQELIRARALILTLQTELNRVRTAIGDGDNQSDILDRIQRYARIESLELQVSRLREAFDCGSHAMLDRLIELAAVRVISREYLLYQKVAINDPDTQLEGRP